MHNLHHMSRIVARCCCCSYSFSSANKPLYLQLIHILQLLLHSNCTFDFFCLEDHEVSILFPARPAYLLPSKILFFESSFTRWSPFVSTRIVLPSSTLFKRSSSFLSCDSTAIVSVHWFYVVFYEIDIIFQSVFCIKLSINLGNRLRPVNV